MKNGSYFGKSMCWVSQILIYSPSWLNTLLHRCKCKNWRLHLQAHLNQELVQYFLTGLVVGFRIGLTSQAPLHSANKSMSSALAHPSVVDDYLQVERDCKRIAGPFLSFQCQGIHISRFGVIPKGLSQINGGLLETCRTHPGAVLMITSQSPFHTLQ